MKKKNKKIKALFSKDIFIMSVNERQKERRKVRERERENGTNTIDTAIFQAYHIYLSMLPI